MTNYIRPISFTTVYDKFAIQDYLEECEDTGETPTQEGFNKFATRAFECMLEEYPRVSEFDRSEETFAFDLGTIYNENPVVWYNPEGPEPAGAQ